MSTESLDNLYQERRSIEEKIAKAVQLKIDKSTDEIYIPAWPTIEMKQEERKFHEKVIKDAEAKNKAIKKGLVVEK